MRKSLADIYKDKIKDFYYELEPITPEESRRHGEILKAVNSSTLRFSGDGTENPRAFLNDLKILAKSAQYPPEQMINHISRFLTDKARSWYHAECRLQTMITFYHFIKSFQNDCIPIIEDRYVLDDLRMRTEAVREPILNFV